VTDALGDAARVVEARRAADVVAQQALELVLERRVGARGDPLALEFVEQARSAGAQLGGSDGWAPDPEAAPYDWMADGA